MVKERLPVEIEPTRYAKQRREIRGTLRLADMPRLCEQLASSQGEANVDMAFEVDEHNFVVMRVTIKAQLPLECQRTLEVFNLAVDHETTLSPIYHESEAKKLPANYEPLVMQGDTVTPLSIVEDELLLLLPIVPKKPLAEGESEVHYASEDKTKTKRENPFDVLADLKLDDSK